MTRLKLLVLILFLSPGIVSALPQPAGMSADGLRFSWNPVAGASLYRVAVWQDKALVSAVWVKTTNWTYGDKEAVVPKAGKLASTAMPLLVPGGVYRLWVSAANAKGFEKSGWAINDFIAPASAEVSASGTTPTATATMTLAVTPTITQTPASPTATVTATPVQEEIPIIEFREKPEDVLKTTPEISVSPSP